MDKETARHIVQTAIDFDINISKLLLLADKVDDRELSKKVKDCADTIMGIIDRDIILPLTKIYPDIDPER